MNQLKPQLANQAQTSCINELQNQLAQNIPSALTPSQLYPAHINLCIIIKIQLEHLLNNAANLANQLKNNALSPQERQALQNQLTSCQNLAQQLQNQYNIQKSICIALNLCLLIEGQLQNLNNQVNTLMFPGGNVSGLESQPGQNVEGVNVPTSNQAQICNLQIKILACMKIKFQICVQLCQALSSCNNTVPTSSLLPTKLIPSYLQNLVLPTPQQELSTATQYLVMSKLGLNQQRSLCNNLGALLPQKLTPSQVLSQCNNYVSNLFP